MDSVRDTTHIDAKTVQLAREQLREAARLHTDHEDAAREARGSQAPGEALVLLFDGDDMVERSLDEGETLRIGRSVTADLLLEHPEASRRHAVIERHGDTVRILDDRSLNGIFVNGARVEQAVLHEGDDIRIAGFSLRVLLPGKPV